MTSAAPSMQAAPERYASPALSMLPTLSWQDLGQDPLSVSSPFLEDSALLTDSGRSALIQALRQLNLVAGQSVLVPAYLCPSIPDALGSVGIGIEYYRVDRELNPDMADLRRLLNPQVRALLAIHYFGTRQNLKPVRELCTGAGVPLIEDCAHLMLSTAGTPVGTEGDFSIASIRKFLPIPDGGALWSRHPIGALASNGAKPGSGKLRHLARELQRSATFGGLGPLSAPVGLVLSAVERLERGMRGQGNVASARTPGEPRRTKATAPWPVRTISDYSRGIIQAVDLAALAERRQQTYRQLRDEFQQLPGASLWSREPLATDVPYVLPVLLDDPARQFPALKRRRVPLWRWEQLPQAGCPVSTEYMDRLVQVPCHQALSRRQIAWLAREFRAGLAGR